MHGDIWYKADYAGYEGLAEYVVSQLLLYSNLERREFVVYQTEEIRYKRQILKGCSSRNFLSAGDQLLTLERMFQNAYGESMYKMVFRIRDVKERGREVDNIVSQYLDTVRPMHEQFIEPSKRYADIIIPEGGHNLVAIDLLVTKINSVIHV